MLITDATYRFVGARGRRRATSARIEVKGKTEPVRAYEVLGLRAQPASARGLVGLESPMVGRDEQLAAPARAAGRCARRTGSGRADRRRAGHRQEPAARRAALRAARRATARHGSRAAACPSVSRCRTTSSPTSRDRSSACARSAEEPETRARAPQPTRGQSGRRHGSPRYAFLGHLLGIPLEAAAAHGR